MRTTPVLRRLAGAKASAAADTSSADLFPKRLGLALLLVVPGCAWCAPPADPRARAVRWEAVRPVRRPWNGRVPRARRVT